MADKHLISQIETCGPKKLINNNDESLEWVFGEYSLEDIVRRSPNVLSDIFEELNNDWIDAVVDAASELNLTLDDDFNVVKEDDEFNEDDEE